MRGELLRIYIILLGGQCGRNLSAGPNILFKYSPDSFLIIGQNVTLGPNVVVDKIPGATLKIGDNSKFTGQSFISSNNSVCLGADVLIAEGVHIHDADHRFDAGEKIRCQAMNSGTVYIGDDVWVGCNVSILAGTFIGAGSIVAAGAVVKGDLEPYSVYAGIPAKYKKPR